MKARDVFEVAVRIVGFLTTFMCVVRFLFELPYLLRGSSTYMLDGPTFTLIGVGTELVLAAIGLALLFGGQWVTNVVYSRED